MNPNNKHHLSEKQLIQALVDPADLPETARAHLAACSQCLADRNGFEHELVNLAQKAEQNVPLPQRRIILPAKKVKTPLRYFFAWRNLVATAATVTAVFLVVWSISMLRNLSQPGGDNLAAEIMEAEKLMTEVNTLVDNALPTIYLEISGEKLPNYDEEFYRFLIPTIKDNVISS